MDPTRRLFATKRLRKLATADTAAAFDRGALATAAQLLGAARSGHTREISAAKVAATLAADRAARTALQVHGAIGYTREYELSRFLTRVRAALRMGTLDLHRSRVLA